MPVTLSTRDGYQIRSSSGYDCRCCHENEQQEVTDGPHATRAHPPAEGVDAQGKQARDNLHEKKRGLRGELDDRDLRTWFFEPDATRLEPIGRQRGLARRKGKAKTTCMDAWRSNEVKALRFEGLTIWTVMNASKEKLALKRIF